MKNYEYFVNHKDQYCVHIPEQLQYVVQIPDLTKFYEPYEIGKNPSGVKPLLQGHTIKSGDNDYRTERIIKRTHGSANKHCYVFIDITINAKHRKNPFAKTPSTVVELLKSKKIVITNFPY
mgnify:CR=1 FL=1